MAKLLVDSTALEAATTRVRRALEAGDLRAEDLTARQLAAFLGQTTSVLYHHWGSLDGFLFAVSMSGFDVLTERLQRAFDEGRGLTTLAEMYMSFAFEHPALYALMFEHRFDWKALERDGILAAQRERSMRSWYLLVAFFEREGTANPAEDARLFSSSLHGLATLADTGRINTGSRELTDRELALRSARRLARMFLRNRTHAE